MDDKIVGLEVFEPQPGSARLCAMCNVGIDHKKPHARYCTRKCQQRMMYMKNTRGCWRIIKEIRNKDKITQVREMYL